MGMSCVRATDDGSASQKNGVGAKATYELVFDDVKSFLQEYRANLQRDKLWVPLEEGLSAQEKVILRLKPPFFKQRIIIGATVMGRRGDGYDVAVEALTPKHKATLEAYSGLCESIWEECMRHLMAQVGGSLMPGSNPSGSASGASGGGDTLTRHNLVPPPQHASLNSLNTEIPAAMHNEAKEPAAEEAAATDLGIDEDAPTSPRGGQLDQIPLARALSQLALEQLSGTVRVLTKEGETKLELYRGWLIRVNSPQIEERTRLGDILVKTGVIDERVRDAALRQAQERDALLGQTLIRTRKITARSLKRGLERQLRARMVAISRMSQGSFVFEEGSIEADPSSPPVNPVRVFYERWVRAFTKRTPVEVQAEEKRVSGFVCPDPAATGDISILIMDHRERELWELIRNSPSNLDRLYMTSPLSRRQTHAVVFALKELGLVEFREKI